MSHGRGSALERSFPCPEVGGLIPVLRQHTEHQVGPGGQVSTLQGSCCHWCVKGEGIVKLWVTIFKMCSPIIILFIQEYVKYMALLAVFKIQYLLVFT